MVGYIFFIDKEHDNRPTMSGPYQDSTATVIAQDMRSRGYRATSILFDGKDAYESNIDLESLRKDLHD